MLIFGTIIHSHSRSTIHFQLTKSMLTEYITFHEANRERIDSSRYLVHVCKEGLCGGVGDRLRGLAWTLKAAIATKRVFMAFWYKPLDISMFLDPVQIKWNAPNHILKQGLFLDWIDAYTGEVFGGNGKKYNINNDRLDVIFGDTKVILLQTNLPFEFSIYRWKTSDAFTFEWIIPQLVTFKSNLPGKARVPGVRLRDPYIGLHLRLGGMIGEGDAIASTHCVTSRNKQFCTGRLQTFLSGLSCALKARYTYRVPIVIITDDQSVKQFFSTLSPMPGVFVFSQQVHHLDKSPSRDLDDHMSTFIELYILSNAKHLILSQSGFSDVARSFAQNSSYKMISLCDGEWLNGYLLPSPVSS